VSKRGTNPSVPMAFVTPIFPSHRAVASIGQWDQSGSTSVGQWVKADQDGVGHWVRNGEGTSEG